MIAFNFNIIFNAEPSLDDGRLDPTLETINIVKRKEDTDTPHWPVLSDWLDMSGRKARYLAQQDFSDSTATGSPWALEIADVVTLFWSINSAEIYYEAKHQFTPDRLRFWVCHTVLPLKFALEKQYEMLHVGAVEVAGRPIFFSASSFGGKSTLTDYFIQQGHALYSDDSLALYPQGEQFYAVASYPFHRPYREPEVLGYPANNVAREAKPVLAGYVLEKVAKGDAITITELKGVDKFKAFHLSGFIDLGFFKTHHFEVRTAMANAIQVYKITIPWELSQINKVYDSIIVHCSTVSAEKG